MENFFATARSSVAFVCSNMKRNRLQFAVSILVPGFAVTAVAIAIFLHWTKPYAIIATYPNGQCAYEQWERRTLSGKIEHIKTLRWFPDGELAFEGTAGGRDKVYWTPDGERFDGTNREAAIEWHQQYGHLIDGAGEPRGRPYDSLLKWFNR